MMLLTVIIGHLLWEFIISAPWNARAQYDLRYQIGWEILRVSYLFMSKHEPFIKIFRNLRALAPGNYSREIERKWVPSGENMMDR